MMELEWEDHEVPDGSFFTKDLFDKYSLAPNVRELWTFLHSDVEPTKTSSSEAPEFKDNSQVWQSCDSDDPCAESVAEGSREDGKVSKGAPGQIKIKTGPAFPEPRVPFPCTSSLSSKEHNIYLSFLTSKNKGDPPQNLQQRVNDEVIQFTRYLQDVAKICADDYNFISQGAMQYSEECFRDCSEYIRALPQLYQIHEMTSLTGGTFSPELALTFEKQLLALGNVNITDHQIVPADAQLASDYQSVSSQNPPAKKAKDMHATISGDGNALKLCDCYEPHVCLTRDALVRLLDNHGPDFGDQWELPVWVRVNQSKGSSQKKTVFIDSPLLKTEMTVRERSHIFHEESLKLSYQRHGRKNVFHLLMELPDEQQHSQQNLRRNVAPLHDGIDFDVDITELETFGESTSCKAMPEKQDKCFQSREVLSSPPSRKTKDLSEHPLSDFRSAQVDGCRTVTGTEDLMAERSQPAVNGGTETKTEQTGQDGVQGVQDLALTEDSDDEKLVIDDSVSAISNRRPNPPAGPADGCSPPASSAVNPHSLSPGGAAHCKRPQKRERVTGDQLGEILRMQTAMLKSSSDTAKPTPNSPGQRAEPTAHSHPTSLVKPCVSSYLERHRNEQKEDGRSFAQESSVANVNAAQHKKILAQDLQTSAEDEKDYEAPVEGNLLYKLYSLHNMLLMVRSSVSLTHSRKVGGSQNQFLPLHVLPKLEYQLSYGVECLTNSEVCQLWTETLLHSSTLSYIAHINALTSKVALLRKLPDNWKQSVSCGFKLSKSLNILHHLLKKLTGLDEGQYLISHSAGRPFVTLLRAADGKAGRELYDLHQAHSSTPSPQASGLVPWVPVNPAVVLDFHRKHGRVPCTFPPKQFPKIVKDGPNNTASRPKHNLEKRGKTNKSKQNKRAAKRRKFINKLIHKSV